MTAPSAKQTSKSREVVWQWFTKTAPLIRWDVIASPLGALYIALTDEGLCNLDFAVAEEHFLQHIDPMARTERDSKDTKKIAGQLEDYFAGKRTAFDLPLDLSRVTTFQYHVLRTTQTIPAGTMWTYGQVAKAIGKPKASRAVGQALGRNPVPIVVPCHRVVASNGQLGGYSGGGGVESKKLLLRLENAL
ncbi:MAG: methylated-DNA--[protein]-cysteine S-methyltransferase [Chloroflexi bacterium]|nr:MAG: cysteine methyltransferase [Phototrophicales bacterium]RMF77773.1 MAG: methylated-DNA--[protein]-cysteine S-methyltransferase [Chloroflexota bacterium]